LFRGRDSVLGFWSMLSHLEDSVKDSLGTVWERRNLCSRRTKIRSLISLVSAGWISWVCIYCEVPGIHPGANIKSALTRTIFDMKQFLVRAGTSGARDRFALSPEHERESAKQSMKVFATNKLNINERSPGRPSYDSIRPRRNI